MAWAPDYITAADLKDFMQVTHTGDDAVFTQAIGASSRAIDRECMRQFGSVTPAVQRIYTPLYRSDRGRWVIDVDDLMDDTGLIVEIDGVGVVTDYTLEPVNAAADGKPWERIAIGIDSEVEPDGVEHEGLVTAAWGWTAFPPGVVLACTMQSSRWANRRTSPFGVAGSPEQGSEVRLLAKLDPDVAVNLNGLRRRVMPR